MPNGNQELSQVVIVFDGGRLGNGSPDSVGYGSYCIKSGAPSGAQITYSGRLEFGKGITSNQAEYHALLRALMAVPDPERVSLTVRTDSALLVGQLSQGWKVKSPRLTALWHEARSRLARFGRTHMEKVDRQVVYSLLGH